MKAILLSAGQGRRLLPHTADRPKCSVTVGDRSLLEWQLSQIARCAFDEVVVVSGYRNDIVEDIVAASRYENLRVRTTYNPFYEHSDNLASCWLARHEMYGDFVLINGDTLFESAVLGKLLKSRNAPITLAADSKDHFDDDDMLIVSEGNRLIRVGKRLNDNRVNGESIGMLAFDAVGANLFRDKLDEMMRNGSGMQRWYLSAIDELAQDGLVGVCRINGLGWCEVDTPFDLSHAANVVKEWDDGFDKQGARNIAAIS